MKPDPQKLQDDFMAAYAEYNDAIFRYCLAKTSNRDKALDLAQDTFTKAWQYLAEGKEVGEMRPFLYRIASNAIIDEYRKKKTVSLDALTDEGFDHADDADEAAKHESAFEGSQALAALETLDPKYRDVLMMRYVEDMAVKEIAAALGESENTISVRIHRGIEKLRTSIPQ